MCITLNKLEQAEDLVNVAKTIKTETVNINTWCNQGMLALKKSEPDYVEVERAAFRMIELKMERSKVPCIRSRVDFAYWLSEADRTVSARKESFKIFSECYKEVKENQRNETERKCSGMEEYVGFHYLKFMVRYIKSPEMKGHSASQRLRLCDTLDTIKDLLITLLRSRTKTFLGDMWVWLAELQLDRRIPRDNLKSCLDHFEEEAHELKLSYDQDSQIDAEGCLNRAINLNDKIKKDVKLLARIAKNCLLVAREQEVVTERRSWLQHALSKSEQWMKENHWVHMCASTCASAKLGLWAIKFYERHPAIVVKHFKDFSSGKTDMMQKFCNRSITKLLLKMLL